jgi:hypothetical protein
VLEEVFMVAAGFSLRLAKRNLKVAATEQRSVLTIHTACCIIVTSGLTDI